MTDDNQDPQAEASMNPACFDQPATADTLTLAEHLGPERIDRIADLIVRGMPDGIHGFTKTWGWQQFARSLLAVCSKATKPSAAALAEARQELLNTPELRDFAAGVQLEAQHQRERWGSDHDAGKTDADWFWLIGHLASKALHARTSGNTDKALHHTISTAAALANWHAAISGADTRVRPGIDPAIHGLDKQEGQQHG